IQYGDYAHWQRDYLVGEVLESQLDYWQTQLDELPAVHGLSLDYSRGQTKRYEGALVTAQLPATTAKQLIETAKTHNITPFMLLHGALSLLLSRHSNTNDIVIGTPVANRLDAKLESLIGYFVNTLVLRADTSVESHNNNLADYFAHIRQIHLDAQSHQDVPFEQLVECLKTPRSTAHTPLFQIMMLTDSDFFIGESGLSDATGDSLSLPGVDISTYQSELVQEKFDLTVSLNISEQGVGLHWSYDVSLFTQQHIEQLNDHMCRLLEGLSQVQTLSDLSVLSKDEVEHLVFDLNDTTVDYPKDHCIHQLFEQQAELNPNSVAITFDKKQLTYSQLNDKANQLAHYLKEHHNVKPDTLVGLCVERSLEMVIGIMGILKAGGAYVPLDSSYPQDRLSYMYEDAALDVVLSQTQVADVLSGFEGSIVNLDGLAFCSTYPTNNPTTEQTGLTTSNLAYVIYTSGSTGKPKGVMLEHLSVLNFLGGVQQNLSVTSDDKVLGLTSINFDIHVLELYLAFSHGASLVLASEPQKRDPLQLSQLIEREQVTLAQATPSTWNMLIDINWQCDQAMSVLCGGEALPLHVLTALQSNLPNSRIYNMYGPTETTVWSSMALLEDDNIHLGKPIMNTQLYLLDDNQQLVP
ncbi:MAG: AMP-binding protein, partial [Psychrosphaera sp.]|nr:AMP-binding protein [Psychrosphaera sp.]